MTCGEFKEKLAEFPDTVEIVLATSQEPENEDDPGEDLFFELVDPQLLTVDRADGDGNAQFVAVYGGTERRI